MYRLKVLINKKLLMGRDLHGNNCLVASVKSEFELPEASKLVAIFVRTSTHQRSDERQKTFVTVNLPAKQR